MARGCGDGGCGGSIDESGEQEARRAFLAAAGARAPAAAPSPSDNQAALHAALLRKLRQEMLRDAGSARADSEGSDAGRTPYYGATTYRGYSRDPSAGGFPASLGPHSKLSFAAQRRDSRWLRPAASPRRQSLAAGPPAEAAAAPTPAPAAPDCVAPDCLRLSGEQRSEVARPAGGGISRTLIKGVGADR